VPLGSGGALRRGTGRSPVVPSDRLGRLRLGPSRDPSAGSGVVLCSGPCPGGGWGERDEDRALRFLSWGRLCGPAGGCQGRTQRARRTCRGTGPEPAQGVEARPAATSPQEPVRRTCRRRDAPRPHPCRPERASREAL